MLDLTRGKRKIGERN